MADINMNLNCEQVSLDFGFVYVSGAKLRGVVCGTKISTTQFIIESDIHS